MKQKSLYTVKQATMLAYNHMPEVFSLLALVQMARSFMGRPHCTDGTITRRLRELREEQPSVFGYIVIDTENSKYRKTVLRQAV